MARSSRGAVVLAAASATSPTGSAAACASVHVRGRPAQPPPAHSGIVASDKLAVCQKMSIIRIICGKIGGPSSRYLCTPGSTWSPGRGTRTLIQSDPGPATFFANPDEAVAVSAVALSNLYIRHDGHHVISHTTGAAVWCLCVCVLLDTGSRLIFTRYVGLPLGCCLGIGVLLARVRRVRSMSGLGL